VNRILLIDVGNSRLKWGLHEPQGWTEFGATPNNEVGTLAVRDWQNLPRPERIAGVNVAGEAMRTRIEVQMTRWRVTPQWLVASASAGGVTNRYTEPEQLGADRWAAPLPRQRIVAAESAPTAALVINAGTAVTRMRWMLMACFAVA
jgi:type III pantothenate kinase